MFKVQRVLSGDRHYNCSKTGYWPAEKPFFIVAI